MVNIQNTRISPILSKKIQANKPAEKNVSAPIVANQIPTETKAIDNVQFPNMPMSSKLKSYILAHSAVKVDMNKMPAVPNYKNNLRTMFVNNEASIMAVIPRTMNSQDLDGNAIISDNEVKGNFMNAVERLDELKDLGINTLHVLPVNTPGMVEPKGTAGSLYSPKDFLEIDPELRDKNDPRDAKEQFRHFINECHKRDIKVMLDLPSCASIELARKNPNIIAKEKNGEDKTPGGWQDIRMLRVWDDEEKGILNQEVLQIHKDFVDMCIDLGLDGIRADVARAKPVEFWNIIIPYSRTKDPEFAWLAESYTYEDASPTLNMTKDRPEDLLEAGFDSYYGQYHIFHSWGKANELHDYVIENIRMNNVMNKGGKSLIGSFATHDDPSPMFHGGGDFVRLTTGLQATLPQMNPYFVDGVQSGDYYLYPYKDAVIEGKPDVAFVHQGQLDIFNVSRKPGGDEPELGNFIKSSLALKEGEFKEVINKGSYIPLNCDDDEVIAFARHLDGKTLLVVANRNMNMTKSANIQIPRLKINQKLNNLLPTYGEKSRFQTSNEALKAELGAGRIHVFEIDTPAIEKSGLNVYKQNF